jgi:MbtH protein
MSNDEQSDDRDYQVVVNHEEQYSIWAASLPIPPGWTAIGPRGKKGVCLAYIKEVWTDMRPLSLRQKMDARAAIDADRSEQKGSSEE